jgi:4-amino-4-deoxy-L-arabinose transferase-like glycosyltransferase
VFAFTAAAGLYTMSTFNDLDEAWFLQVVARVSNGETLYKDVYFHVPPLSVYVTWPVVGLFGAQLAWVKVLVLAAFAAGLILAIAVVRQLDGARWAAVLVCGAMLVFNKPYGIGLYQPLASAFTLACLSAGLAWAAQVSRVPYDRRRELQLIGLAGIGAGASFSSKPNVGLYTLAALLGAILVVGAGRRAPAFVLALGGFTACALLPLLPVVLSGGFGAFIDYGFADIGTYNKYGGVSYLDGMLGSGDDARDFIVKDFPSSHALYGVVPLYQTLLYLIIPLTLLALALAWWRSSGSKRGQVAIVGLFALAAAAGIFPRADPAHVAFASPVLLVAAWYGLHLLFRELSGRARWILALGVAVSLLPGVLVRATWPAIQMVDRDAHFSALPHTRGILINPVREETMLAEAEQIGRAGEGRALFLATANAGFWYLETGVQNPTPFDFPLVTAMGSAGEKRVVDAIEDGEIAAVCLGFRRAGILTPRRIVRAVGREMDRGVRTNYCTFYEQRGQ